MSFVPKKESGLPDNSLLLKASFPKFKSIMKTKGLDPIHSVNTGPYFLDNSIKVFD